MKAETQNIESTFADEKSAFIDEVELFKPAEAGIKNEAERLRAELANEQDQRLRLAAEFDNYRRRTRRERAEAADEGKRELLMQMLSVTDDLDLALANLNESSGAVAEGLRMVHRRFHNMLEANCVVGFESKGEMFNPERHEAFDVIGGTEGESGTVQAEVRRGYFWNGKLLRPALVMVAQ